MQSAIHKMARKRDSQKRGSLLGRLQSADQKCFRARGPKTETQKCSTKRGVREPLKVEFALKNRRIGEGKSVRERSVRANDPIEIEGGTFLEQTLGLYCAAS